MDLGKKGIAVKSIVGMVIAIIIIVMLLSSGGGFFAQIGRYVGLIEYNRSVGEAPLSRVGFSLEEEKLRYFSAEKWVDIDTDQNNYFLNDFEFNPKDLQNKLKEFYSGERNPEKFIVEINKGGWSGWRYWEAEMENNLNRPGWVKITDKLKEGYEPKIDFIQYLYYVDAGNNLRPRGDGSVLNNAEIALKVLGDVNGKDKVILWRDQILAGNYCEKYMSFNIKGPDDGQRVLKDYKVNRRFEYIFIDLDEDVIGETQKWGTKECEDKKPDNYVDNIDRSGWKNEAQVVFYFEETDGRNKDAKVWFGKDGWEYQGSRTRDSNGRWETVSLEGAKDSRVPDEYWGLKGKNIYQGINYLFGREGPFYELEVNFNKGEDIKIISGSESVPIDVAFSGDFDNVYDSREGNDLIRETMLEFYDKYNKYLRSEISEDFLNAPEYVFVLIPDDIFKAGLHRIDIKSKNPLNLETETIHRVLITEDLLGGLVVVDTLSDDNLGFIDNNGKVVININLNEISSSEDIKSHLESINGLNLEDRYYEIVGGGVGNIFAIEKRNLPEGVLGGSA